MKKYSEREVKRSIRNLQLAIDEIITANSTTYRSKVDTFIELTKIDPIIKQIVDPFRKITIDFDAIHYAPNMFEILEIRLPKTVDEKIAYIIQMFDEVIENNYSLDKFAMTIYNYRSLSENVNQYLRDIAVPRLRELQYKLDDLLEDEIEGKGDVTHASFQIINRGTIQAHQGSSIALGKDIQQTVNYNNVSNDIMKKVRDEGIFSEDKISEIEMIANDVEEEINKSEPSPSKLKQLAGKAYEIGEQGILKIFTSVVTDPRWGQAVAETLMNM